MGGVRNREAKKAAAKVFSSGGGSSKGPSTVDKRAQELRCPHCDKVYTQSNQWRLKEHIATKHADRAADTEDGEASTTALAVAAMPEASATVASASAVPAAAATLAQDLATPAVVPGAKAAAGMMDVGSGGGYFTSKSPKLLLQEHCARNHRPKPRYTRRALDSGLFGCKVVLPDTKRQENDIVIFLDEEFAAPDEQEAQQRAALAALQRVAGDAKFVWFRCSVEVMPVLWLPAGERPLHNVLPKQYVSIWHSIGTMEAQRKKAAAERLENEASRRQREKERMAREALRAPQVVVMSEAKQQLVQSLLLETQQLRQQAGALQPAGVPPPSDVDPEAARMALDRLVVLGFRAAQAQQAVTERGTAGGISGLLDWLLLNCPSDQLPSRFRAGSKTNAVTLVNPCRNADVAAAATLSPSTSTNSMSLPPGNNEPAAPGSALAVSPAAARLSEYGYEAAACEEALLRCEGDEEAALMDLYSLATGICLGPSSDNHSHSDRSGCSGQEGVDHKDVGNGTGGQDDPAWAEEVMVLEAIYADAVTCLSGSRVRLRLPSPQDADGRHSGRSSGCEDGSSPVLSIEFWHVPGSAPHPQAAPLITARCAAMLPPVLLQLTRLLAQEAMRLTGEPYLHALAARAAELLHEVCHVPGPVPSGVIATMATGAARPPDDAADMLPQPSSTDGAATALGATDRDSRTWDDEDFEVGQFQGLALGDEDGQGIADLQHGLMDGAAEGSGREAPAPGTAAAAAPSTGGGGHSVVAAPMLYPRRRPLLDVSAEAQRLAAHQRELEQSPQHAEIRRTRQALPAYGMRADFLTRLANSAAVVISGATGCGKSTQVPQYILEDAIARGQGGSCSIICTQPRRISALGLAHRVSSERGEEVGGTVGYAVRLDTRQSARTRLLFCTTGILLRRLLSEPDLEDLTHIILDEVHERSIEIDLLLLLLRELAARRAAAAARPGSSTTVPLRLVLMSATADADLFVRYMQACIGDVKGSLGNVTQLTIPGFTHPVRELYLEDVFDLTQYVLTRKSRFAKKQTKTEHQELASALAGAAAAGAAAAAARAEVADEWDAEPAPPPPGVHTEQSIKNLAIVDEQQLNFDLIVELVTCIVARQQHQGGAAFLQGWQALDHTQLLAASNAPGAILVFLPGAPEIGRLSRSLLGSEALQDAAGGRQYLRVLPLHGSLSAQDQARVFVRPPRGVTKIVLATNVAETSITIDDVTVVVDTGRAKEMQYDTERGLLRLQEQWVSQAAAMQRRGRAGRVRPGVCFRLFSNRTWLALPTHTPPEMLRSPLESVCLLIKGMMQASESAAQQRRPGTLVAGGFSALGKGGSRMVHVADVLGSCLSPPSLPAVVGAVTLLRAIGALDGSERLTGLGQHLNKMPMDPRVGKMLLYGCLLGCLDPVLTVAAALAHGRPLFMAGAYEAQKDLAAQRTPLLAAAAAQRSDHVALVAAFNAWAHALAKGGRSCSTALCAQMQLSESTLEAVAAGRAEYAGVLTDLGFLPHEAAAELAGARGGHGRPGHGLGGGSMGGGVRGTVWLAHPANRNASNGRFLKAAICAGFYPNVLRVQHPPARYKQVDGGAFEMEAAPQDIKFFDRHRGRAFLHPGSVNFNCGKFDSGWLVFTQMTHTTKLYVRESSMAPVYALLLFGGELRVDHEAGMVRVDDWAEFRAPAVVGVLVFKLRGELDRILLAKIAEPDLDLAASKPLAAVMELLSTDGF